MKGLCRSLSLESQSYSALTSPLRNSAVPTGLRSDFPLDPALRLRLRAGL